MSSDCWKLGKKNYICSTETMDAQLEEWRDTFIEFCDIHQE